MADWQPLGKHQVRVEGDIVHAVWQGEVRLADVQLLFALYGKVHDEQGRAFALSDMRESGVPDATTRRWIAEWMSKHPKLNAAAAYGANVVVRAVFVMLLRGIRLVSKSHIMFDVVATEADGRAFIDRVRSELSTAGHR